MFADERFFVALLLRMTLSSHHKYPRVFSTKINSVSVSDENSVVRATALEVIVPL